jgi:hypothetical protein
VTVLDDTSKIASDTERCFHTCMIEPLGKLSARKWFPFYDGNLSIPAPMAARRP